MSLFFLPAYIYYFIGKIFVLRTKAVASRCSVKKCLKYLVQFIRKHLYRSLFFQQSCRIVNCKSHRCFLVNLAKILRTPILQNICERRSHSYESIYHMIFLAYVYLAKKYLRWCLLIKSPYLPVKFLKL